MGVEETYKNKKFWDKITLPGFQLTNAQLSKEKNDNCIAAIVKRVIHSLPVSYKTSSLQGSRYSLPIHKPININMCDVTGYGKDVFIMYLHKMVSKCLTVLHSLLSFLIW